LLSEPQKSNLLSEYPKSNLLSEYPKIYFPEESIKEEKIREEIVIERASKEETVIERASKEETDYKRASKEETVIERAVRAEAVNDYSDHSSSKIGQIGEQFVIDLLENFRNLKIKDVSKTGHLGDIHVIDDVSNVLFMLEIKNKDSLNTDDITKFEVDIDSVKKNSSYEVFGVFISLRSRIPKIGEFIISQQNSNIEIFLTEKYVNRECFSLIFEYATVKSFSKRKTELEIYKIPENVYTLIQKLNSLAQKNTRTLEIVSKIRDNAKSTIAETEELFTNTNAQIVIMNFITEEFKDIFPQTTPVVQDKEKIRLTEYLCSIPQSKIRKLDIINNFPLLRSELAHMTLDQIKEKYITHQAAKR
jgi:hypothetical protein